MDALFSNRVLWTINIVLLYPRRWIFLLQSLIKDSLLRYISCHDYHGGKGEGRIKYYKLLRCKIHLICLVLIRVLLTSQGNKICPRPTLIILPFCDLFNLTISPVIFISVTQIKSQRKSITSVRKLYVQLPGLSVTVNTVDQYSPDQFNLSTKVK